MKQALEKHYEEQLALGICSSLEKEQVGTSRHGIYHCNVGIKFFYFFVIYIFISMKEARHNFYMKKNIRFLVSIYSGTSLHVHCARRTSLLRTPDIGPKLANSCKSSFSDQVFRRAPTDGEEVC
jgi:hypothetical protein